MIQPDEIRRKSENLYSDFLCAWLAGEPFFPRTIPANRELDASDHAGAIAAITALRDGSKAVRSFGYSIEWREKRSRAFGRNPFPERVFFETQNDFLRLINKQSEFATFANAVERLRAEFPELKDWIRSHRQLVIEVAPNLDGLLDVLRYFRATPRPNLFARELPLSVDTKFIEQNERVLRDWFDIVLPPDSIRSDETHFARRYGLRYPELLVFTRLLDPDLQRELNCPWSELSLPVSALAQLPVRKAEVIIVENKVTLLTLPSRRRTIAFGALGRAVSELRLVRWLTTTPITYWGDLDVEGFEILSSLRAEFPHTASLLMDEVTLTRYRSLAVPGSGRQPSPPPHMTSTELLTFGHCRQDNLRVEQERLPHLNFFPPHEGLLAEPELES
jgi:hypothetical protein